MENEEKILKIPSKPTNIIGKNKASETYSGDMLKILEQNSGGLAKKIINEQTQMEADRRNYSPDSGRNRFFLYMSIFLILLSLGGVAYVFLSKPASTVSVVPSYKPLIFLDKNSFLEVGGLSKEKEIYSIVNHTNNTRVALGEVEGIYLTVDSKVLGLRDFLKSLEANITIPADSGVSDTFLIGVMNERSETDIAVHPHIFLFTNAVEFSDLFNVYRAWEGKMFLDLHALFGLDVDATNKYLLTKDFEDGFVENKNARILYDQGGKIVIMYVYLDDNTVLIADDEKVVEELITRLQNSKIKK